MIGTRTRTVLFYGATAVFLVLIVTKTLSALLPPGIATQVGHNSESLAFAMLVVAGIHLARRLNHGRSRVPFQVAGALVLILLGILLLHSGWRSSLVTLNEGVIGAGLVLLYLVLPRSPLVGLVVAAATGLFIVVFFDTALVLDQAESLVPLLLCGPALDVFDRTILQPRRPDRPLTRALWMAVLFVAAIGFSIAAHWARQDLEGPLRLGIDYGQRAAEAYWGWLLVHFYFSIWLGKRWRERSGTVVGPSESLAAGAGG